MELKDELDKTFCSLLYMSIGCWRKAVMARFGMYVSQLLMAHISSFVFQGFELVLRVTQLCLDDEMITENA